MLVAWAKRSRFARRLLDGRGYELLLVEGNLVRSGIDLMARLADKRLGLTDCTSFALMSPLGIETASAFDTDFRGCGYLMMP